MNDSLKGQIVLLKFHQSLISLYVPEIKTPTKLFPVTISSPIRETKNQFPNSTQKSHSDLKSQIKLKVLLIQ